MNLLLVKSADTRRDRIDVSGGEAGVQRQRQDFVAGAVALGTVYRIVRGERGLPGNGIGDWSHGERKNHDPVFGIT